MSDDDSAWEFDCPNFVDFTAHPFDEETDFFEKHRDEPVVTASLAAPSNICSSLAEWRKKAEDAAETRKQPQEKPSAKGRITRSSQQDVNPTTGPSSGTRKPSVSKEPPATRTSLKGLAAPSNICSSLAEWRKKAEDAAETRKQPQEKPSAKGRITRSSQQDVNPTTGPSSGTRKPSVSKEPPATRTSLKGLAAPSNICSSLAEWRKKAEDAAETRKQPQEKPSAKGRITRSSQQDVNPTTGPSSGTRKPSVSKEPPATRTSLKRSHSFTKSKQSNETEGASPAAKLLKRGNSTSTFAAPNPMQRSSSASNLNPQRSLKRSSSSSLVSEPNKAIKRSITQASALRGRPGLKSKRLRQHSRSLMTRSRSSSIGARPTHSLGSSTGRERRRCTGDHSPETGNQGTTSTVSNPSDPMHRMPRLKRPTIPTFMRQQKFTMGSTKPKTTEEIEMERITQIRKDLARMRQRNQQSYKKALAPTTCIPIHQANSGRNVRLDTCHRQKGPPAGGITVVQPFNLTETKRKTETTSSGEKFKSVAEQVKQFHLQTPDRFRTKTKDVCPRSRSKSPPRLTIPKTPSFETRGRTRPVTAPTRQEQEEKEIEEMKRNQFKARPVNSKIFNHPESGLKKVDSKPVTQPQEFSLTANHRAKAKGPANSSTEEERFEFHSKPVPTKILEGVVGVKPAKRAPATVPHSPAFALKHRARLTPPLGHDTEEDTAPVRRRPVPHTGVPFQPKLPRKHVQVEPFTFDERDKERWAKKEKIEHVLEEEKKHHDFVANPLRDSVVFGEIVLPAKHPKPVTKPNPFALATDIRGKSRQEEFKQKLDEEMQTLKEKAVFKANDSEVLHKEPFVPKKCNKPLIDVTEFKLNTERRANEREVYEQRKKCRQAEVDAFVRQEELRKKNEEEEAISHLRHEMVHRANPVRNYKTVAIQRSRKPPTIPTTPQFSTTRRLRCQLSHSHDDSF